MNTKNQLPVSDIGLKFTKQRAELEKALLSSKIPADRFIRIMTTLIKGSDKLQEIAYGNWTSVISATMKIAALGLDPAIPNEVSLVPFKQSVEVVVGYKGLAKLALRGAQEAGQPLRLLNAFEIYENDTYIRKQGDTVSVKHSPAPFGQDRGKLLGFCAVAKTLGGAVYFAEMSVEDVKKHQAQHSQGAKYPSSPFHDGKNIEAYGLKTVLKRLINRQLPLGTSWGNDFVQDVVKEEPIELNLHEQKQIGNEIDTNESTDTSGLPSLGYNVHESSGEEPPIS